MIIWLISTRINKVVKKFTFTNIMTSEKYLAYQISPEYTQFKTKFKTKIVKVNCESMQCMGREN